MRGWGIEPLTDSDGGVVEERQTETGRVREGEVGMVYFTLGTANTHKYVSESKFRLEANSKE